MNNDYLAHYGVKGMKWGVRKDRGIKGTRRHHVDVAGGMRVVGGKIAGGARVVGRAAGRGALAVGRAAATVPGKMQAANAAQHKKEALEAIRRGDAETVKKNAKYISPEEVQFELNRINAEKRLMAEISAQQKKTGAAAVADALNGIGNSRMANAVRKGAAEGLQSLTKTAVSGVGSDAADVGAKAVGGGIGAALLQYAMYKTGAIDKPNYKEAFKKGSQETLRKMAKDKYGIENLAKSVSDKKNEPNAGSNTDVNSIPKAETVKKKSQDSIPRAESVKKNPQPDRILSGPRLGFGASAASSVLKGTSAKASVSGAGIKSNGSSYQSVRDYKAEKARNEAGEKTVENMMRGYREGYRSVSPNSSADEALRKRVTEAAKSASGK